MSWFGFEVPSVRLPLHPFTRALSCPAATAVGAHRLRYLDPWVFFSVTAALLAYAAFVLSEHRKAQQDGPPRVKTS